MGERLIPLPEDPGEGQTVSSNTEPGRVGPELPPGIAPGITAGLAPGIVSGKKSGATRPGSVG